MTPPPSPSEEQTRVLPSWLRRFARLWGLALFVLFVMAVFRSVMLPFVLGLLIAYTLAPLVSGVASLTLGRRRIGRGGGVLVVYVGLACAVALFVYAFVPPISADVARLFREAPRFFTTVKRDYVPAADAWLERNFPREAVSDEPTPRPERKLEVRQVKPGQYEISLEGLALEVDQAGRNRYVIAPRSDADEKKPRLADLLGRAAQATESQMKGVLLVGQRFVASLLKAVVWFLLAFMVAAYLLVDSERVLAFLRSLVPEPHRPAFDEVLRQVDHGVAGVIRGQLIICVVNAVLTTVGLLIFHVKYALLLGVLAGAMSFIPVFGSILSSVPIVTIALASGSGGVALTTGLEVLAWISAIHLLEANVFNPKIIGSAAKIHPVVVVFALLVGEQTGGIVGALLAVPIASIVQSVFLYFRRRAPAEVTS